MRALVAALLLCVSSLAFAGPVEDAIAEKYRVQAQAVAYVERLIASENLAIDPQLVLAVICIESAWNPWAESYAGALGLMQVMPDMHGYTADELRDGRVNVHAGVTLLNYLVKTYGVRDGVRRYNGRGPAAEAYADKVLAEYEWIKSRKKP